MRARQPIGNRLSPAEVAQLWHEFTTRPAAAVRETLILQYAPLVKFVIGRLMIGLPTIMDFDDVLSEGTTGLIEAVERYDPTTGVKFETYAISRIRGSIIDALRRADRLPRSVRKHHRKVEQMHQQLRELMVREPEDLEIANALGIPLARYYGILTDASWVTVSLDKLLDTSGDSDGYRPAEMPKDPDAEDVGRAVEQKEIVAALTEAIEELPDRERLVVALYYQDELTQREIAKVLGISESRVCQLHARALARLRSTLQVRQAA